MANVSVPSLQPGERSLPAELRASRGVGFAQRRMAASLQPSANPTFWNQRRLMGLRGLGQDDGDDFTSSTSGATYTSTGVDLSNVISGLPTLDTSAGSDVAMQTAQLQSLMAQS